jgi:hypothetical protein
MISVPFAPDENDAAQPLIELAWPCARRCCDNSARIVITDALAAFRPIACRRFHGVGDKGGGGLAHSSFVDNAIEVKSLVDQNTKPIE